MRGRSWLVTLALVSGACGGGGAPAATLTPRGTAAPVPAPPAELAASTTTAPPATTTGPPASTIAPAATTAPAPAAAPAQAPASTASGQQFAASVATVTAADLPSSWRAGCPVGPAELRMIRLSHWGFDGQALTGRIVVHVDVVDDMITVFRQLYERRFPIRRIEPVDLYGGDDDASMAADNTSAFNCRNAVGSGPPRWSVHAYGKAIDVNPVENPYVFGGQVLPPAGAAYTDRSRYRPGMAVAGGDLTAAFAAAGWSWGGEWAGSPDYQHFSATGG